MNRKSLYLFIIAAVFHAATMNNSYSGTGTSPITPPNIILSQNLTGMSDWTSGQPFLDVLKYMRTWQTANAVNMGNNAWATDLGQYLTLDANGWPTQVPCQIPNIYNGEPDPNNSGSYLSAQQIVHSLVNVEIPGNYRLRFLGTGTFTLGGQGNPYQWSQTFSPSNIAALPVDASGKHYFDTPYVYTPPDANGNPVGSLYLEIDYSTGTNYLRNFELVTPGYATNDIAHNPFNPQFLATLQGYNTLRMMDWGAINNSPLISWTNRTLPNTYTQSQLTGVALEYMIMICNQLGENLWLNIPHQADPNYIQNAALLILNGAKADGTPFNPRADNPSLLLWPPLNANLKVYLEYSNETWNSMFQQSSYVVTQGCALRDQQGYPFNSDNYTAGEQFAAYQSANIWQSFYQVWGTNAPRRLIRVLAGLMDPYMSSIRLGAFQIPGLISVNQLPDVLAIAPYFGSPVADNLINSGALSTTTTAQILQAAAYDMTNSVFPTVASVKAVADQFGVKLNCYEAGQSLLAGWTNIGNTNLTAQLIAANRDPGMGSLYSAYMTGLSSAGVVEMANFSHLSEPSQFGSWGCIEYLTQPLSTAYKYQALLTWMSNNPIASTMLPPTIQVTVPVSIIDTYGSGSVAVRLSASNSVDYFGTITSFTWTTGTSTYTGITITPSLPVGVNSIIVTATNNHGASSSKTLQVVVRPQGSDTVLVQSSFLGTAPGEHIPWTNTSTLSPGVNFGGWTYLPATFVNNVGEIGIGSGTSDNNVFGVNLEGYGGLPEHRCTLSDAVNYNEYLSCTITPNPGQMLDLRGASVQWTIHSNNSDAAQQCTLMTSLSGFSVGSQVYQSAPFNLSGADTLNSFSTFLPFSAAYMNVTNPVEIRIYLSGNCFNDKSTQLSAFQLTGALKTLQTEEYKSLDIFLDDDGNSNSWSWGEDSRGTNYSEDY